MTVPAGSFPSPAEGGYPYRRCLPFNSLLERARKPASDETANPGDQELHAYWAAAITGKSLKPVTPGAHNLFEDLAQWAGDSPLREMTFYFSQIAVITDVVADPVLLQICVTLRDTGQLFNESRRLRE